MNYQEIINRIFEEVKQMPDKGKVASYIPALAEVYEQRRGVFGGRCRGEVFYSKYFQSVHFNACHENARRRNLETCGARTFRQ